MPKTASDPYFATNTGGRKAAAVTPDPANDLQVVTNALIVTASAAGNLTVIMANDADSQTVVVPIAIGTWLLPLQVRRVTAAGAGISCVALWG
jgi:hypothetical protein